MLQNVSATPARRTLEFGIYRDGDNNLDAIQGAVLGQALRTSQTDSRIQFTVEDTTRQRGRSLHTNDYTIADGQIGDAHAGKGVDMSDEANLRDSSQGLRRWRWTAEARRFVHVDARHRQGRFRRRRTARKGTS
jgi:hypothetical protein